MERNKPCPCGSGKKYKKCCYLLGTFEESPIQKERTNFKPGRRSKDKWLKFVSRPCAVGRTW